MSDRLTPEQATRVEEIAELTTRRYFDHYLQKVLPVQLESAIKIHDSDDKAHGGVERKFLQARYVLVGFAVAGGFGAGTAITNLLPFL